jgi:predicted N-formylglutamate amidohydrolase
MILARSRQRATSLPHWVPSSFIPRRVVFSSISIARGAIGSFSPRSRERFLRASASACWPAITSRIANGFTSRCAAQRTYFPYREWVYEQVRSATNSGERVLHLSCHSFTPRLSGVERRADVGLLYDPRRAFEREFCTAWQRELESARRNLIVRRNYPYRGYADGLTTDLRRRHPHPDYAGIELEVNQKFPLGESQAWRDLRKILLGAFQRAIERSATFR